MLLLLGIMAVIGAVMFLGYDSRFAEERSAGDNFATVLGVFVIAAVITVFSLLLKGGM